VTTRGHERSYIPTIAGLLLFGENPEDFLTQSKIKLEAHRGNKIVTSDIGGSILLLPTRIREFFEKNIRTYTEISGFERVEVPEYPWEALREALVNAIVHRDYNEGARTIIQIFPDKVFIKSPGLPLRPISLEKIRTYNAPPYSRNPRIAETFYHMKLMEERGWGLTRMRDLLLNHNLKPPEFNYESGYFVVTFFSHERPLETVKISPDILKELNNRQKKSLDYICKRGRITSIEYAKKFKIDQSTALKDLKKLMNLGVIKKMGSGRSTYYIFNVS
jgi:predicted HTH transcriptional regulator